MLQKLSVAATHAVVCLAAAAYFCSPTCVLAQERPWSVSSCELLKHPGMYDESLVSVPGLVLYGQQEFSSHGYDCTDDYGVLRLEFGGNPSAPKDRFRLSRERLEAGTVPLRKDTDYDTMQRLMKSADATGQAKMLRATLNGRFFAGPAVGMKSGEIKHPNARLVISEVELVTNRFEDPVDFTPRSHAAPKLAKGCKSTEIEVPSREEEDKLQRLSREPSENLGYLTDPKQVSARSIPEQEKIPADEVERKLVATSDGSALKDYAWTSVDGLRTYSITVNRPYWLLPSTYSADTLIWVPKRVLLTTCANNTVR
jgi:hypothetical protein